MAGVVVAAASATGGPPIVRAAVSALPDGAMASTTSTEPVGSEPVPDGLDLVAAGEYRTGLPGCSGGAPAGCIQVRGSGLHVFLLGDSNAAMFLPMFRHLAADHDLTLSAVTAPGCPWQEGLGWLIPDADDELRAAVELQTADCERIRGDAFDRVIPALAPDLVVTAGVPRDDPARGFSIPMWVSLDPSLGEDFVAAATSRTLDHLTNELGVRVAMIEPVPYGTHDPVACLMDAATIRECAVTATVDPPLQTELVMRAAAAARSGQVVSIDIDPIACPNKPVCLPILDGELVYRDAHHLYPPFLIDHRAEIWDLIATGLDAAA